MGFHQLGDICFRSLTEPLSYQFHRLLTQFSHSSVEGREQSRLTSDAGLAPISAVANSVLPLIGITRRRTRQVESVLLVREQREKRTQELAFQPRPFVVCGLPLRRPVAEQLSYTRRNGKFFLQIVAHPQFGLPTVRADCTCLQFTFGMGRNSSFLPPAAGSAI